MRTVEADANADSQNNTGVLDLRALVHFLRSEKWVILLVALSVAGGFSAWVVRLPPIYEASTSLVYDPTPPNPLHGDVKDVAAPWGSYFANREYFQTQNEIIKSRSIANRVVERLGLHNDPSFFHVPDSKVGSWEGLSVEQAAVVLSNRVVVEPRVETRMILVNYRDRDPERAKRVANVLAEEYLKKTLEDRAGATKDALEWMNSQLAKLKDDLQTSEIALHEFKRQHEILSVDLTERQNMVTSEIEALSSSLTSARTQRVALEAKLAQLDAALAEDPLFAHDPRIDADPEISDLRGQLRDARGERERLSVGYGPQHPEIMAIDARVALLEAQLAKEIEALHRSAVRELKSARTEENALRQLLDDANQAGLDLNLREIQYGRLQRSKSNNEHLYELLLERAAQANLTKLLKMSHVNIVDTALLPQVPVSPKLHLLIPLGILLGAFAGLLTGFVHSRLDRVIRSPGAAEELGLSVLGVLPSLDAPADGSEKRPKRKRGSADVMVSRDQFVLTNPRSPAAECCRTIRTNLTFLSVGEPVRTLAVTSAGPREGKTTVATNLALTMALSGKRVLLVDADLRRPRIHRTFGVPNREGLSNVLAGDASLHEVTRDSGVKGLDLCTSGPIPPNPSELLHSAKLVDFLRSAADKYDQVLFDSPPLGVVTDAAILAHEVAGTLIVINAKSTTRESLVSVIRQLRDVDARILGGVVNSLQRRHGHYGYEQGYYQYYGVDPATEVQES